jgi:hypothetical protein
MAVGYLHPRSWSGGVFVYSRTWGEPVAPPTVQVDDELAKQAAEDVLRQADSVLDALDDDADFDGLLRIVDQLARIVARQIESRQIYDVVEQTRGTVLARKDAQIARYLHEIEEEKEILEIMEIL